LQTRRQLVRDHQNRHLPSQLIHRLAELLRSLVIEIARRFIEDEDRRPFEQRSRNGNALLLSAGESRAVLADGSLVALRKASIVW
jgi:hypothetical protein